MARNVNPKSIGVARKPKPVMPPAIEDGVAMPVSGVRYQRGMSSPPRRWPTAAEALEAIELQVAHTPKLPENNMDKIEVGDIVINTGNSAGPAEGEVSRVRYDRNGKAVNLGFAGRSGNFDAHRYTIKTKVDPLKRPAPKPNPHDDKYPAAEGWTVFEAPKVAINRMHCCGLLEIHGIQTAGQRYIRHENGDNTYSPVLFCTDAELVKTIHSAMVMAQGGRNRAFWIFTDNSETETRGSKLAAFIQSENLGPVTVTGYAKNHNSGNMVQAYVWQPDHAALAKWVKNA